MKTNRIYSVLSKGQPYGDPTFSRFVQENAFAYERDTGIVMLDALVPYNDQLLRAVYAERLTQFLVNSQLQDRALELDPVNGYNKSAPQFPTPGPELIETNVTDPFSVHFVADVDTLFDRGNGRFELVCFVDAVAETLTYNAEVFNYTVTNGLSTKISIIPGLSIKMRSDFAASTYVFTIRYTLPPKLDWDALWRRVGNTKPVWTDPSLALIWEKDPRWDQRLAAYVMSAVELFNRA